jgi:hypothetical protein
MLNFIHCECFANITPEVGMVEPKIIVCNFVLNVHWKILLWANKSCVFKSNYGNLSSYLCAAYYIKGHWFILLSYIGVVKINFYMRCGYWETKVVFRRGIIAMNELNMIQKHPGLLDYVQFWKWICVEWLSYKAMLDWIHEMWIV